MPRCGSWDDAPEDGGFIADSSLNCYSFPVAHTIPFDTHAYVKKLTGVGIPEPQAEVQAEAIANLVNDQLATKSDLHGLELALKRDIEELKLATKRDIEGFRQATKQDIEELKLATKRDLKELELATKRDIEEFRQATKQDIEELKLATKRDLKELELRLQLSLTLRQGGMSVAAVVIVAALVKLI